MPWVKVDDNLPDHPKLAILGGYTTLGLSMYVAGLCYCNRYLTDGAIPKPAAARLLDFGTIEVDGEPVDGAYLASLMVAAGLWDEDENEYRVHDYAEYQPSREKVLADRAAAVERMSRIREAKKAGSGEVPKKFRGSSDEVQAHEGVFARSSREVRPTPVPVPVPTEPTVPPEPLSADAGKRSKLRFVPPTEDEVRARIVEKGYKRITVERFCHFYGERGWVVGKAGLPMVSWRDALARAEHEWSDGNGAGHAGQAPLLPAGPTPEQLARAYAEWLVPVREANTAGLPKPTTPEPPKVGFTRDQMERAAWQVKEERAQKRQEEADDEQAL